MLQQGQVFKLTSRGASGEPLWAYRHRTAGRGSGRVQRGGFATEQDAREALERSLEKLRRGVGIGTALTLAELVEQYLAQHDAAPVTVEKLRWLLAKAVGTFGDRRLGELRSEEIAAWRMTISPGCPVPDGDVALKQAQPRMRAHLYRSPAVTALDSGAWKDSASVPWALSSRRMTQVRDPLLETKLHVPRGARGLVPRDRLRERLSVGGGSSLTLISAPAGFGKTTLITEWLAAVPPDGPSVGWLSLDEADNDPSLFWKYVVAALRSVAGREVGAGALSLLESSQAPIDATLTTLINDLCGLSGDVILVLDDYHVIEAPEVHDGVVFLLEHLPPQLQVVIASRADPPFSLARWRGDGELTEIRAADLRFTPEESATYLDGTVEGALTAQDVATLDQRTEGWIAALQLAALSMQGRDDLPSFIAGFAGDDRYIVDYLVEEVLQRQSEDVRQFLLQTSILDRLTGPLCDAVTGQANGGATLVTLERANLFLIPLDDRRRWYRYHHLFADVLRAHLLDGQANEVPTLHGRASGWFERSGEPAEAIRHALAGGDFDRAANLAEIDDSSDGSGSAGGDDAWLAEGASR